LLAPHYKFLGADHQTLLTVDDYLNNRRDYAKAAIAGTFAPLPATSVPINPFGPVNSVFIPMDDAHFTSQTTRNNAVDSAGAGLTHRATFFERLILDLRYRHDYVRGFQQAPNAATTALAYTPSAASGIPPAAPGSGREARIHDSNDLYSVSFSYRLTPNLSWYAARTGSFIPFGTSVPLTVSGTIVDPRTLKPLNPASETGVGYETGFKGEFLDRALIFSVDGFDTRRQNVGVSELSNPNDPSSPTVTLNEGDQRSKGFEVDGQYLIARKLLFYVSYSYVESREPGRQRRRQRPPAARHAVQ
jgi:outer membrane receptor for monomeric catechols